jgi:hypothetical protein
MESNKNISRKSKKINNMKGGQFIPTYTETSPGWHNAYSHSPYAVDLNVGVNEYTFSRPTPDNKFVVSTGLINTQSGVEMIGGKKSKPKTKKDSLIKKTTTKSKSKDTSSKSKPKTTIKKDSNSTKSKPKTTLSKETSKSKPKTTLSKETSKSKPKTTIKNNSKSKETIINKIKSIFSSKKTK